MLHLLFREDEREIRYTDSYFNNNYQDEWMEDPLVREIIKEIDQSELIGTQIVMSPVLGAIPVTQISGGAKALILMLKSSDLLIHGNSCGDNCAKWIAKIGDMKDIYVHLTYPMRFPDDIRLIVDDTDTVCESYEAYVKEYLKWSQNTK
jgi:hypothetical protein